MSTVTLNGVEIPSTVPIHEMAAYFPANSLYGLKRVNPATGRETTWRAIYTDDSKTVLDFRPEFNGGSTIYVMPRPQSQSQSQSQARVQPLAAAPAAASGADDVRDTSADRPSAAQNLPRWRQGDSGNSGNNSARGASATAPTATATGINRSPSPLNDVATVPAPAPTTTTTTSAADLSRRGNVLRHLGDRVRSESAKVSGLAPGTTSTQALAAASVVPGGGGSSSRPSSRESSVYARNSYSSTAPTASFAAAPLYAGAGGGGGGGTRRSQYYAGSANRDASASSVDVNEMSAYSSQHPGGHSAASTAAPSPDRARNSTGLPRDSFGSRGGGGGGGSSLLVPSAAPASAFDDEYAFNNNNSSSAGFRSQTAAAGSHQRKVSKNSNTGSDQLMDAVVHVGKQALTAATDFAMDKLKQALTPRAEANRQGRGAPKPARFQSSSSSSSSSSDSDEYGGKQASDGGKEFSPSTAGSPRKTTAATAARLSAPDDESDSDGGGRHHRRSSGDRRQRHRHHRNGSSKNGAASAAAASTKTPEQLLQEKRNRAWAQVRWDHLRILFGGLVLLLGIGIACAERDEWARCGLRTMTRAYLGTEVVGRSSVITDAATALTATHVYIAARSGIFGACITASLNMSGPGVVLDHWKTNAQYALTTVREPRRDAAVFTDANARDWILSDTKTVLQAVGFARAMPVMQVCTSDMRDHAECEHRAVLVSFTKIQLLVLLSLIVSGLLFLAILLDLNVCKAAHIKINKWTLIVAVVLIWSLSLSVWLLYSDSVNAATKGATTHAECELEANMREVLAAFGAATARVTENHTQYEAMLTQRNKQGRADWNETETAQLAVMRGNLSSVPIKWLAAPIAYLDDCVPGFSLWAWLSAWILFTLLGAMFLYARASAHVDGDSAGWNPFNVLRSWANDRLGYDVFELAETVMGGKADADGAASTAPDATSGGAPAAAAAAGGGGIANVALGVAKHVVQEGGKAVVQAAANNFFGGEQTRQPQHQHHQHHHHHHHHRDDSRASKGGKDQQRKQRGRRSESSSSSSSSSSSTSSASSEDSGLQEQSSRVDFASIITGVAGGGSPVTVPDKDAESRYPAPSGGIVTGIANAAVRKVAEAFGATK